MTTLEPEQRDILEKLNEIALEENWGTVDRVHTAKFPNGIPKGVAVIQEAMEEIKRLRELPKEIDRLNCMIADLSETIKEYESELARR